MGMPHWEDDPDFSIDHHLHHATLPEPGDEAALQAFVERKMQEPLDRSRPLWHFYVIDGYQGGSVVVSRFHHALADGMALAEVLLSLTDEHQTATCYRVRRAAPCRRHRAARAAAHHPARGRRPVRPPGHRPGLGRPARCPERWLGELPAALHPSYAVEALTTAWQTGQIADKLLLGAQPRRR